MQPCSHISLYLPLHDACQNLKPSLLKQPTLSLQLVKPLQLTFLLPITVFDLLGFCYFKSWSSSGIHHLIQGRTDVNSKPNMVINRASCAAPGHHLHGSSSSLNHWATSSTSSPATHRHCICLQHDLLTALKTQTGTCKCCFSTATLDQSLQPRTHVKHKSFFYPKQSLNVSSQRPLSVKRELDDLVLQMQHPSLLR